MLSATQSLLSAVWLTSFRRSIASYLGVGRRHKADKFGVGNQFSFQPLCRHFRDIVLLCFLSMENLELLSTINKIPQLRESIIFLCVCASICKCRALYIVCEYVYSVTATCFLYGSHTLIGIIIWPHTKHFFSL